MKYAILVYETAEELAERNGAKAPEYWGAHNAYIKALTEAGVATRGAVEVRPLLVMP
jgi:hypothetical protein